MIEITAEQIDRVNKILAGIPKGAEKALTGVISRAQTTVRAITLKSIPGTYAITPADVRAETNVKVRTRKENGGIVGYVWFSGAAIPLYRFNVNPKTPTPRETEHVSVGVFIGRQFRLHNAFVAKMDTGHKGIFERIPGRYMESRKAKGKNKHSELIGADAGVRIYDQFYGPSTAQMAGHTAVREKAEAAAMDTIEKRVEHEISRILNGYT